MRQNIYLVGTGITRFGEHWDKSLKDIMREAMRSAIASSKIDAQDIDLVVVANMLADATSDQANLGALASSLLPHTPAALRVEGACASGALALHTACAFLESGRAKNVLVVGAEKMTDASNDAISQALMGAADSELDAPSGITFPGIFGLIARRYMYEYGLTREKLSIVSALHHRNALQNPNAQFRMEVSPEAVTESTMVSDPLRLLDCSPISDGAAACVLSTEHRSDMKLLASQMANDSLSLTERTSVTSFAATKEAMRLALEEARIDRKDIRTIETHDCFSIAALINMEDLGLAKPGEGIRIYEDLFSGEAKIAVNWSGGLKACGHPVAATGIKQVADSAKHLVRAKGRYGLTHNFGGAGASCGIHILENLAV